MWLLGHNTKLRDGRQARKVEGTRRYKALAVSHRTVVRSRASKSATTLPAYWEGHSVRHTDVKSLCCMPETNIIFYVNDSSIIN